MKNIVLLIGLLLCLCASSWGACSVNQVTTSGSRYQCNSAPSNEVINGCYERPPSRPSSCPSSSIKSYSFVDYSCRGGYPDYTDCHWLYTCCDTQAEADSVQIAQKCTSGTVVDSTISGNKQFFCQNGDGLLFGFWDFSTNTHSYTIKYYIHTSTGYEGIDEGTYNHLAAQTCTEVSLYRGVLNGKYVYWYSTDPEPAGVVNVVRIK